MRNLKLLLPILLLLATCSLEAQSPPRMKLALLKYGGGGDWYANPTSLPNLAVFVNRELGTNLDPDYATVDVGSAELFNYPWAHMTGHGNVVFTDADAANLRTYLKAGGFLHIDDNYGMDPYVRPALRKVFPDQELIELPFNHPLFHQKFSFPKGLPKIHKHDDLPPQAFGLFWEGRLVVLYTYECDLGNGWEDEAVHNDPPHIRLLALQMGANILQYVFTQ
jgi:hypothetical protein